MPPSTAIVDTSTADPSHGNPINTVQVNQGSGTGNQELVTLADPTTAGQFAGVTAAGNLQVDGSSVTQPVSIAATVNVDVANSPTVSLSSGTAVELLDSGGSNKASISAAGAVKVDGSAVTQPVDGTVTANQGTAAATTSPWPTEITDATHGPVAVKASATAAATTDPALVVALSPNTPLPAGSAAIGSVSVSNFPGTQPVSGTVTANQGTGAATTAPWPIEITDASHGPAAVKASATAAATTDLSLVVALSPNSPLPAGSAAIGSVSVSNLPGTQPVSIAATVSENLASVASVAVVTGAAGVQQVSIVGHNGTSVDSTAGVLDTNIKNVGASAVSTAATGTMKVGIVGNAGGVVDAAGQNASSPANEILVGAQYNSTPTTITSGNMSPLQMDPNGNLLVRQALARTAVAITLDTTSVSTTEALQTITIAKGIGSATSTGTSYTVTTGNTLRIQACHVSVDASTTALTAVTVRIVATSASIASTSPRIWNVHLGASNGGAITSGAGPVSDASFPDGIEIPSTDLIAVSAVATGSTATVLSVSIVGFEYNATV